MENFVAEMVARLMLENRKHLFIDFRALAGNAEFFTAGSIHIGAVEIPIGKSYQREVIRLLQSS